MVINAMVDRVENGNTYFTLDDIGAEISIPKDNKDFVIGDTVKLIITDNDGKVTVLKQ